MNLNCVWKSLHFVDWVMPMNNNQIMKKQGRRFVAFQVVHRNDIILLHGIEDSTGDAFEKLMEAFNSERLTILFDFCLTLNIRLNIFVDVIERFNIISSHFVFNTIFLRVLDN